MYQILLIVDESFGEQVVELAQRAYVWLVQSEENDRWAKVVWEAPWTAADPLLRGLSTFVRQSQEKMEDLVIRVIDMIDEHHGEYAHGPEWSEMSVIGAHCSVAIEEAARTYGVVECVPSPHGFHMIRHRYSSQGTRMQRRLADVPACGDAGQPGFTNRGSRELLGLIPGGKAGKKIGKVLSKADDVADEAGSVQKARNVGGAAMLRVLSESEVELESFHDCHVHGLRWRRDQFIFSLDLQYILEWIKSSEASSGAYRFLVSEARLVFRGASELKISMDWTRSALDSEIAGVRVLGSRTTPNGLVERCFEIEFADPDGTISVWSTGYEVVLLQEPVVSEVPNIPLPDGP